MTEAQIARAMSLGVVASFFLPHLYYWGEMLRDEMFGPERAARYMPAGSAVRAGMRVSYHTDPPMTWPNALLCMHLAVTRRSRAGNVIGEGENVDVARALRGVTIDAAHHLGMDDRIGIDCAWKVCRLRRARQESNDAVIRSDCSTSRSKAHGSAVESNWNAASGEPQADRLRRSSIRRVRGEKRNAERLSQSRSSPASSARVKRRCSIDCSGRRWRALRRSHQRFRRHQHRCVLDPEAGPSRIALTNGCVCCTMRDDLLVSALELRPQ